eukprot:6192454-Pleurochrysis_carterae.AAC.2
MHTVPEWSGGGKQDAKQRVVRSPHVAAVLGFERFSSNVESRTLRLNSLYRCLASIFGACQSFSTRPHRVTWTGQ